MTGLASDKVESLSDFWRQKHSKIEVEELDAILTGAKGYVGFFGSDFGVTWGDGTSCVSVTPGTEKMISLDYRPLKDVNPPFDGEVVDRVMGEAIHECGHIKWSYDKTMIRSYFINQEYLKSGKRELRDHRLQSAAASNPHGEAEMTYIAEIIEDWFVENRISEIYPTLGAYLREARKIGAQKEIPNNLIYDLSTDTPCYESVIAMFGATLLLDKEIPKSASKMSNMILGKLINMVIKSANAEPPARIKVSYDIWKALDYLPRAWQKEQERLKKLREQQEKERKEKEQEKAQKEKEENERKESEQESDATEEDGKRTESKDKDGREDSEKDAEDSDSGAGKFAKDSDGNASPKDDVDDDEAAEDESESDEEESEDEDGDSTSSSGEQESANKEPGKSSSSNDKSRESSGESSDEDKDDDSDNEDGESEPEEDLTERYEGLEQLQKIYKMDVENKELLSRKQVVELSEYQETRPEDITDKVNQMIPNMSRGAGGGSEIVMKLAGTDSKLDDKFTNETKHLSAKINQLFKQDKKLRTRAAHALPEGNLDVRRLAKAGAADYRLFQKDEILNAPSLAIGILLDLSSSMRGKQWDTLRIASAFKNALAKVQGVDLMITAYYGSGGQTNLFRIYDRIMKEFRPGVTASGGTPSGTAIAGMVSQIGTKLIGKDKLIVHVTDGQPQSYDDVAEAVDYCKKNKIEVMTIALGGWAGQDAEAVKAYRGLIEDINNIDELPDAIEELLKKRLMQRMVKK